MTERTEILEKIRKLNAHAQSAGAIGSEAEAQAFAAKVQELLTTYKLNQADLGVGEPKADEPIGLTDITWEMLGLKTRSVRIGWTEQLAALIGDAYYCRFILKTGYHGCIGMFCGADTERAVATQTYVTMAKFLFQLAKRENNKARYSAWVAAGKPSSGAAEGAHGFKTGFMFGFITRLKERFDEEVKGSAMPRPEARTKTVEQVNAIVLVRKNAMNRVNRWSSENLRLTSCSRSIFASGSREGREAGRSAANAVNLRERKQLS